MAAIIVILFVGMPRVAHATAQIPDILVVEGDTLYLFCNPLEGYFDAEHPRPDDMYGLGSTACWRNYQAYFELRKDSLFLTGIRLDDKGDSTDFYPLSRLFGDKATPRGVFASWVNEPIVSVSGDLLYYIHMGYASLYEFDIEYVMHQGIVKEHHVYDNRKSFLPFSDENYGATNLMQTFVESQIDYTRLAPKDMNSWLEVHVQKVDADGRIKKVKIPGASAKQMRAIQKALKKVPRFNVLYSRGQPITDAEWIMEIKIYANAEEQAKHGPTKGPDVGDWIKRYIEEGDDYVGNLERLSRKYRDTYDDWKACIADTSAKAQMYRDYYCRLYGDPLLYEHHYFNTLADSALKYYYQYWDETGDHQELYPIIVRLEQELGVPHNPKIIEEENPQFEYLVLPEEMGLCHEADTADVNRRCRQVSYHLRGFGEGDMHGPLPQGILEEWRFLLLRGDYVQKKTPVLVKVITDGKEARIVWRIAKEDEYKTYPGLDHFRHGIKSEGQRVLSDEEWKHLKALADTAGIDTLYLANDFFTSPPAIYNIEHRTAEGYHVVNDYNHPYYSKEINPLFWPFRALCKYLLQLADPTLPFDSDDDKK
ncbi:MAG: hypothetical protein IJ634_04365 [Bacteroidales bacterium]|nr:hypothetical protein [Bacteroidales bacterium]